MTEVDINIFNQNLNNIIPCPSSPYLSISTKTSEESSILSESSTLSSTLSDSSILSSSSNNSVDNQDNKDNKDNNSKIIIDKNNNNCLNLKNLTQHILENKKITHTDWWYKN